MRIIYEPRGRAKEYAELACNLYMGCTHGCKYCYAPACMRCSQKDWKKNVYIRKRALELFERDAIDLAKAHDERAILFSFLSDPYQPLEQEEKITHQALEIVKKYGLRSKILTKGAEKLVSVDFDLMKAARTEFGVTISFVDDKMREKWEPQAAPIKERFSLLKRAHQLGIYTWVSLEPVIDPEQALKVIKKAMPYVDFWKIGKLNHMKDIEGQIDWVKFREDLRTVFARKGKVEGEDYYIKQDLLLAK